MKGLATICFKTAPDIGNNKDSGYDKYVVMKYCMYVFMYVCVYVYVCMYV